MNKEDFVSPECAKLLKERGYNEPCYAYYRSDNLIFHYSNFRGESVETLPQRTYSGIDAPSLYEAQKWIWKTHKKHVCVFLELDGWYYEIERIKETYVGCDFCDIAYKTYEEAFNAGIIKALKLIEE